MMIPELEVEIAMMAVAKGKPDITWKPKEDAGAWWGCSGAIQMVAYPTPPNLNVGRELGPGREQSFPTSLPTPLTTTSGRRCSTSSTTSALSLTFSLSRGICVERCITKRQQNFTRKAKDTDYLLITEDMKTYGCGCCSIGLGKSNLGEFVLTLPWVDMPS